MLKIYGVPISMHARKTLVAVRLKGLAFESDPVVPFSPPEGWNRLSPTGLIPAIDHDGFVLADSAAINAYLEKLQPTPPLYPADAKGFARAVWLERYASEAVFRDVTAPVVHELLIGPKLLNAGPPDQAVVERVHAEALPRVFGYLEEQLAGPGARFAVGELSAADIAIASNCVIRGYLGFAVDKTAYPKLAAWFDDIVKAPAFAETLAAEAPFVEQLGLEQPFL